MVTHQGAGQVAKITTGTDCAGGPGSNYAAVLGEPNQPAGIIQSAAIASDIAQGVGGSDGAIGEATHQATSIAAGDRPVSPGGKGGTSFLPTHQATHEVLASAVFDRGGGVGGNDEAPLRAH